ncbi:MAG: hypothetical protein QM831_33690 [Kofleriaceae bacterium]
MRYDAAGAAGIQAGQNAGNGGAGYPSNVSTGSDAQGVANPGPGGGGGGGGGGYVVVYTSAPIVGIFASPPTVVRAF